MAAETTGVLMRIFLENMELISTSLGSTSEYAGISSTSSNVKPSNKILSLINDMAYDFGIYGRKLQKKSTPETLWNIFD